MESVQLRKKGQNDRQESPVRAVEALGSKSGEGPSCPESHCGKPWENPGGASPTLGELNLFLVTEVTDVRINFQQK